MNGDEWLEAQRVSIEQVIAAETEQARLAQRLIPEVTVPDQTRTVSSDRLDYGTNTVDDQEQLDIERYERDVPIPKLQTDDPDPARALVSIRRASLQLARGHDERVFRRELADQIEAGAKAGDPGFQPIVDVTPVNGSIGEGLVASVADAIAKLDDQGYRTGYAMVTSNSIWTELHRQGGGSPTLPIDAVRALLDDGPVHRSSVLHEGDALLMSLGEGRIDRVVAEAPRLTFVDQTSDERNFNLYERFVPRLMQTLCGALLRLKASGGAAGSGSRGDARAAAKGPEPEGGSG
jgi:Encapsulating protein for peroxidase